MVLGCGADERPSFAWGLAADGARRASSMFWLPGESAFALAEQFPMRAMVLERRGQALEMRDRDMPQPGPGQILVRVAACGVCRTDLHVLDGELPDIRYPIVPGHEIIGTVAALGAGGRRFAVGAWVGIGWLGHACGVCPFCRRGEENLCDRPEFTGCTRDGGFAEYTLADEDFCFPIEAAGRPAAAAPLMCAGLIGYRSLVLAGPAERLGIFGFGAAAHIVAQVARHQQRKVFAFTRPGDEQAQEFARSLGAVWAGDSETSSPEPLDAAIIFAPVGALVPAALRAVRKGGVVVCGGIHMSPIPSFSYDLLWGERVLRSVANLTRRDGDEFLALAPRVPVQTATEIFPLAEANQALARLRRSASRRGRPGSLAPEAKPGRTLTCGPSQASTPGPDWSRSRFACHPTRHTPWTQPRPRCGASSDALTCRSRWPPSRPSGSIWPCAAGRTATNWPLVALLFTAGAFQVALLAGRLARLEFGSDLLAGISIVTSALIGEYLAGAIVVLMLSGGAVLEQFATRRAAGVLQLLARRMPLSASADRR